MTLGIGEPFTTTLTVTLIFALILSLPVLLHQLYAFLTPAIDPRSRKRMAPLGAAVPVLFVTGVAFGYFVVLPAALHFFQNFNSGQFNVLVQASQYYKFSATTLLAMGLLFEVPVAILAATGAGVITPGQLRKNRRYAVGVCALVAAVLPGDAITMLLETLPLYGLFELSVLIASIGERRTRRREARAQAVRTPRMTPRGHVSDIQEAPSADNEGDSVPDLVKEATVATTTEPTAASISEWLGDDAEDLLGHTCETIDKSVLHLPGPDFIDRVMIDTDRSISTLRNLRSMYNHGRLAGTGYLSILPVDQGIEHSAGASFAPNPAYFDPANIVELAIEGGCNAVASTIGVLGAVSRSYAHRIPFIVKLNHNELLTYPNQFDQVPFGSVKRAWDMGATGVGATIYFGSEQSTRQIREVSAIFEEAHSLGMFTVLWCYLRNPAFKQGDTDYHLSADLTGPGQPPRRDHRGRHHQAEAAGEQQRLRRHEQEQRRLWQDLQARLQRADHRSPDRPVPLPGGQLLHGPRRPHQQRRRLLGRVRPRRGGPHRRDQQARRRHGPDQRPQGLPAPDAGRREDPQRHPGRVSGQRGHGRLGRRGRPARWASRRGDA